MKKSTFRERDLIEGIKAIVSENVTMSKITVKFEKALAEFHDMKYAIVTSNCTTALHLSLKALNGGKRARSSSETSVSKITFLKIALVKSFYIPW